VPLCGIDAPATKDAGILTMNPGLATLATDPGPEKKQARWWAGLFRYG
jgi:hypothetical protein